jgi:hypothetical protein
MNMELVEEYKSKIEPILPAAKRANGSRKKSTPEHEASRQYTKLLVEFHDKGGSLPQLASALSVAYSGIRRRVVMNSVSVEQIKPKTKKVESKEQIMHNHRIVFSFLQDTQYNSYKCVHIFLLGQWMKD